MHLNTAVSALMELVNELYAFCGRTDVPAHRSARGRRRADGRDGRARRRPIAVLKEVGRSAGPDDFAVHAAHGRGAVGDARPRRTASSRPAGPTFDEAVAKAEEIVVPVQINGKVRARLTVPAGHARTSGCASWRLPIRRS